MDHFDPYIPQDGRYGNMSYRRCGASGILLPAISLGLWHNFGDTDNLDTARAILRKAFNMGITHFDLANNYGPPYGSAEVNFGRFMRSDWRPYRDELFISTKAGYDMWPGPYGNWGSRKYLTASLDQSLRRMNTDYVDLFYHHRPDPNTPLEETMTALSDTVRRGKALYVGLSNYTAEQTRRAVKILRESGTPCLIHQARYSLFDRWVENGLLHVLQQEEVGCIAFSPLAQGLLTDKYLHGIPEGTRASRPHTHLKASAITSEKIEKARRLDELARERGQSLANMALGWLLARAEITSVLIGASNTAQLTENVNALRTPAFSETELRRIDTILCEN